MRTPPSRAARAWTREEALVEVLRGRMAATGPTSAAAAAASLGVAAEDVTAALVSLETEGVILRGSFTPGARDLEWCDRALLARIHRYTLNRLRAEIEPVSPAEFMRFLFAWQHVEPGSRLAGVDGVRAAIAALEGFDLPAAAWERAILPSRVDRYDPAALDMLCLTGQVGWARLGPGDSNARRDAASRGAVRSAAARLAAATPVALFLREHAGVWRGPGEDVVPTARPPDLGDHARQVLDTIERRGASFSRELAVAGGLDEPLVEAALGELVAAGLVASDGFAGLRALMRGRGKRTDGYRTRSAGRWSRVGGEGTGLPADARIEAQARALLLRYGVVCRRVLARETNVVPWRDLTRALRRLEARGEIRGGRFVAGLAGEQFALPEAVARMREVRRTPGGGGLIVISAADPLNLTGLLTAGERVRATGGNRIVYRDGVPLAALEGDYIRPLAPLGDVSAAEVAAALTGRRAPAVGSGYVGRARTGMPAPAVP
jgi:ATP-dependent Lhr-like helicase